MVRLAIDFLSRLSENILARPENIILANPSKDQVHPGLTSCRTGAGANPLATLSFKNFPILSQKDWGGVAGRWWPLWTLNASVLMKDRLQSDLACHTDPTRSTIQRRRLKDIVVGGALSELRFNISLNRIEQERAHTHTHTHNTQILPASVGNLPARASNHRVARSRGTPCGLTRERQVQDRHQQGNR